MTFVASVRRLVLQGGLLVTISGLASARVAVVHETPCGLPAFPATTCQIPATGSGNLLVLGVRTGGGSGAPSAIRSVTDDAGNVYSKASAARAVDADSGSVVDIWYAQNTAPATTVTITPKATAPRADVVFWEFSATDPAGRRSPVVMLASQRFTKPRSAPIVGIAGGTAFQVTPASAACDLNQDGVVNIVDVQLITNMMLGTAACSANVVGSGVCNDSARSVVISAALGLGCHSVSLSWTASTSAGVAGYNVKRSTTSGGGPTGYTKVNSSLIT